MIQKTTIMILFLILLSSFVLADKVLVDINLNLDNIATLKDGAPNTNLKAIIPYDEIIKLDDYIDEQTKLGRTINVNWHIVNYEPTEEVYSKNIAGFHLFDFTWFRLRTFVEYKDKNNQWTSMISIPTGFNFKPYSEATIHSYGDVPVLISPTICPGGFCLGGGGENQGKFSEELIKKIEKDNYRISIIKYPIIKSVYLVINDSNLIGKKLELEGSFILGDSAIETDRKATFFPFDKYSLDLIFTSYYDSKVTFYIEDIEDLSLSSEQKIEFSTKKNENKEVNLVLARNQPIKSILWNIFLILIPFIFYLLERRWDVKWWVRMCTYIIAFICLLFTIPTPLNVSYFNLLNLITWPVYIILIIVIEILLFKNRKNKKRRSE